MATSRSRSRSRSRERVAKTPALEAMHMRLPWTRTSSQFDYSDFMRQWGSRLHQRPRMVGNQPWFPLCKPKPNFPGEAWVRFCDPYVIVEKGRTYAVEFTIWQGPSFDTAVKQKLLHGSANHGEALVFNWKKAKPKNEQRVEVSRILVMSLKFDAACWAFDRLPRFSDDLHTHHIDGHHTNCLLSNLKVKHAPPHIGDHNRTRSSH